MKRSIDQSINNVINKSRKRSAYPTFMKDYIANAVNHTGVFVNPFGRHAASTFLAPTRIRIHKVLLANHTGRLDVFDFPVFPPLHVILSTEWHKICPIEMNTINCLLQKEKYYEWYRTAVLFTFAKFRRSFRGTISCPDPTRHRLFHLKDQIEMLIIKWNRLKIDPEKLTDWHLHWLID